MMKVHDLDIMKDINPLFEKKVVIWGIDDQTGVLLHELKDMGVGENIILCDSDSRQWGKDIVLFHQSRYGRSMCQMKARE